MSEYDDLIEGYDSSLPAETLGPLTEEENQQLEESVVPAVELVPGPPSEIVRDTYPLPQMELEEPPHEPDDWPEETQAPLTATAILMEQDAVDLRPLRADQRPARGSHFVIFNGLPQPVVRDFQTTEDEYVRSQMGDLSDLRDIDGNRQARADRTLRMRYRGYLCGELQSL